MYLLPEIDVVQTVMTFLYEHRGEPWCQHCLVREHCHPNQLPNKRDMSREVKLIVRVLRYCVEYDAPGGPCVSCGNRTDTARLRPLATSKHRKEA